MWHVLNYIPSPGKRRSGLTAIFDAFNASASEPLELFAPTMVVLTSASEKVHKTEKPLLYHYIFVKGPEAEIKRLCLTFQGFSYVIDRTSRRHVTVSDDILDQFRIISRYYAGQLPCYSLEGFSLEEGDRVQIVSGPCTGLTGTYISRKGGRSGNILVAVDSGLAAVVYDIKADFVRVLEFSLDSRRAYDQIDAFVKRLEPVLQSPLPPENPSVALLSACTVFVRRLGVVKIDNPKLNAKLQALLYAAYVILGDTANAEGALERYRRLSSHVTNPKTLSLISHIIPAL